MLAITYGLIQAGRTGFAGPGAWLPITAGIYTANGLLGEYLHARGVARKPGGWKHASYNVPMGPPIAAPGLMCIVGGMGLLAAVLRRER